MPETTSVTRPLDPRNVSRDDSDARPAREEGTVFDMLTFLAPSPIVAIMRAPNADLFMATSEVLYKAGIRCVEFTLTTTGALEAVAAVRASLPADLVVGVGTVRTEQQMSESIDAGAEFMVSQIFQPHLVKAATLRGVPYFPGALTPTEVLTAWESGVPAVKVSPVGPVGGLAYFEQLRGPLPDVPLMPTGGLNLDDVCAYFDLGAVAVGLSGPLVGDALLPDGDLGALAERAHKLVDMLGAR